jgi:hypothetical protein
MTSPTKSNASGTAAPVYQLKVVLADSKPVIWRQLQVPGNASLGWLHAVLQVAMGWTNSHLHHFLTAGGRYSDPRHNEDTGDGDNSAGDETKIKLAQVAPVEGSQFVYEYDFGDSWNHEITVEKILPPDAAVSKVALYLDGARACPPEDCGGPPGYDNLLKILKNRKHPEHESMLEWLGRPFDAGAIDLAGTNACLRKLKWPRVTEAQLRQVLMVRDNYRE